MQSYRLLPTCNLNCNNNFNVNFNSDFDCIAYVIVILTEIAALTAIDVVIVNVNDTSRNRQTDRTDGTDIQADRETDREADKQRQKNRSQMNY